MPEQNFANHSRYVTLFHKVLFPMIVATWIGAIVNLFHSFGDHERLYSAALIVVLAFALQILFFFARTFPLQAQDRAIRAEESLRHYVLAGRLFDTRLTIRQIVALRFAPDAEFVELARKAADTGMKPVDIKKSIKNWKADYDRL
ncbi:MAG TPA: DUF6526 family protein [Bryobacteraceae bacterium]|nr:DUF6526 family protein [Bryobacteraceae bacterium]